MRRLLSSMWFMVVVLALAANAQAQQIVVPAKVRDWTGNASTTTTRPENTTTYVQISGTANDEPFDLRCEANTGCQLPAGVTEVSSRLVFDPTREKLVKCNNVEVTAEPGMCESSGGVLRAELSVRLGKLKLIPAKAPGFSDLRLNTSSRGVTLEFAESSEDHWKAGYRSTGVNFTPDFTTVPAGSYKVYAEDLIEHCKPTQTNDGVSVTVPEGGEAEVTILFAGTECTVKVTRRDTDDSGAYGTVTSSPAGMDCDADVTKPCVGTFSYGTTLALTPQPAAGYKASWVFAECSVSSGVCTKKITSDRTFSLDFWEPEEPVDPEPDAGPGEADAGPDTTQDAGPPAVHDAGAGQDAGTGLAEEDAGATEPDGLSDAGAPSAAADAGAADGGGADGSGSGMGSDDGCSAGGKPTGSWFALLLVALYLTRRRQRT